MFHTQKTYSKPSLNLEGQPAPVINCSFLAVSNEPRDRWAGAEPSIFRPCLFLV